MNYKIMIIPFEYNQETKTFTLRYRTIDYNQENINKYKSDNNLLRHARYIPHRTKGVMFVYGDNLLGYTAWEGNWIIALETIDKYKRKGYGSILLQTAVQNGCIHLTVSKYNEGAIKFYKSQGWTVYRSNGRQLVMRYGNSKSVL